jgi:hypothetical protein
LKTLTLAAFALLFGTTLRTEYKAEAVLRVASETRFDLESKTTMERDGEPVEAGFGGGGMTSKEVRRVVLVDRVVAAADGKPTNVRRTFETAGLESSFEFGENGRDDERASPLEAVTLDLSLDDEGKVAAKVVEGDEPDEAAVLEGHVLELALDGLLPADGVDEGDEWNLDGDAIKRALGLSVQLFPPPERTEEPPSGGEGRRGGRGGPGFGFGGGASRLFTEGTWEGKAKYAGPETTDSGKLAVIELTLECNECKGELADPEPGEGGGRRRGFLAGGPDLASESIDTTFEIELEGKLLFSLDEKRPLSLELEGQISAERTSERSRGESTFKTHTVQSGEFAHKVEVRSE